MVDDDEKRRRRCMSQKRWIATHSEAYLEYQKQYREAHRTVRREYLRAYMKQKRKTMTPEQREEVRIYNRDWYRRKRAAARQVTFETQATQTDGSSTSPDRLPQPERRPCMH